MADAQPRRNSDTRNAVIEMQEEARKRIAEEHGAQIDACERLRDYAVDLLGSWKGRPLDPECGSEMIVAAIFARTLNTYWAIIELARMGFGQQAAMLNRSLFEDMVDAHWVTTEAALAVERYEQHHQHGKMLLADALGDYPTFFPSGEIPEFSVDERQALDAIFGVHGSKSWTGLNLHQKVAAIERLWPDKSSRESLRFYRDIAHRENNKMLHVSAQSIGEVFRGRDEDSIGFMLGPGGGFIARSLTGAFWIFIQTLTLLLDEFGFERDREAEKELFSIEPFRQPTARDLDEAAPGPTPAE